MNGEIVLPKPVLSNGKGKLWKDSTTKEWFAKIQEEVFEAHEAAVKADADPDTFKYALAEELTDVKTVCESYLNALGYNEEVRGKIQHRVNLKNSRRGYFETGRQT